MVFCSTKAAISLKSVKIEEKILWRAYEPTNALSNDTIPTPYGLLFPKIGGFAYPPKTSIAVISGYELQIWPVPLLSQEQVMLYKL